MRIKHAIRDEKENSRNYNGSDHYPRYFPYNSTITAFQMPQKSGYQI